jgi:hypothetical protein
MKVFAQDKASAEPPKQVGQFQWKQTARDSIPSEEIIMYDPIDGLMENDDKHYSMRRSGYFIINSKDSINLRNAVQIKDPNAYNPGDIFPFNRYNTVKPFTDLIDVEHQIK